MTSTPVRTADDFKALVADFQATDRYRAPLLFAVGRRVLTKNGTLASVRYPVVNGPGQNTGSAAVLMKVLGVEPRGVQNVSLSARQLQAAIAHFAPFENDGRSHPNLDALKRALAALAGAAPDDASRGLVASFLFDDVEPQGVEDSTLKLYGMSCRHFRPNTLNLAKIFTKLPNVAWAGDTPMDGDEIDAALSAAAFDGAAYAPIMVDKFPLYVHRINAVKMGVRITDQNKVRLGAYLGEGTTLMPGASYVNFNAGTDGAMVEGRISSSAFVGKGSDIGGGASVLGTLSGGNNTPISIGRNCLLEANCVLGIPVGDAVVIAADTAIISSSRIRVGIEGHPQQGRTVKASDLAGINAATFRRNDADGVLEVVRTRRNEDYARKLDGGESILNADLHKH
ncbi:MAG: tetrahydrodipicolinate N-succinyltransferase N-terminal domain-containing protein [Burkholderiaceae bacterium]